MKKILVLFILSLLFILTACYLKNDRKVDKPDFKYYAYYLNSEKNNLLRKGVSAELIEDECLEDEIEHYIQILKKTTGSNEFSALSEEISINDFEISNQQLILYFDSSYLDLTTDMEILIRAAIVKSLSQLERIQKISFMVNSQPLSDSNGKIIGPMDKNSFVENMGTDINNYQEDILYLYFSDMKYKKLVKKAIRVMRRANIPREKTILEYLFKGPLKEFEGEVLPSIPSELKINSIITKNGVCYIDFSEKIVSYDSSIPAELVLYSIVNSVTEDSNIIKVKFSIDSNEASVYKGIKLDEAFERKDSLVRK